MERFAQLVKKYRETYKMKLYHYSIIFAAIAVVYLTMRDISYSRMNLAATERQSLDLALTSAADAASMMLLADSYNTVAAHKQEALDSFFTSVYAALNCMDNSELKQRLCDYFPFVAICDEDGLYLYSYQISETEGSRVLSGSWSEKIPYVYETEDLRYEFTLSGNAWEYQKTTKESRYLAISDDALKQKGIDVILSTIEETLKECVNHHNLLANQLGLSYEFHLPVSDDSLTGRTISHPSFMFLFQGYPIADGYQQYERFAFHGASVMKRSGYPVTKEEWMYLYHRPGSVCEDEAAKSGELTYYQTTTECAKAGAYPCQKCYPMEGWYDYLENSFD